MAELVFLKLGGSLITDKTSPFTARIDILSDLVDQILQVKNARPDLSLLLGHGSGSFGHTPAQEFGTREGILANAQISLSSGKTPKKGGPFGGKQEDDRYWQGFAEVWFQASALNRLVMEALHTAGLPSIALAPVAAVFADNGEISSWNLSPLRSALAAGLLPVIFGDVVFDGSRGGTILSTEDLFVYLAKELRPDRILLAGNEPGVWADFPTRKQLLGRITPSTLNGTGLAVSASQATDVTGGMQTKVRRMLELVQVVPGIGIRIFSGLESGNLRKALEGEQLGTEICLD